MEFTYRLINFTCGCGVKGDYFTEIGITHDYQMIVRWSCPSCGKTAQALTPLEEMATHAPQIQATSPSLFDEKFCKEAHIRLE